MNVFERLVRIGDFRGGPHNLYKPVVRIEWYEWDGNAFVEVGRCKGMEEVVAKASRSGLNAEAVISEALDDIERQLGITP